MTFQVITFTLAHGQNEQFLSNPLATPPANSTIFHLDTVEVTAEESPQYLGDRPAYILSGTEVDDLDIRDTRAIDRYVPNFSLTDFGNRGTLGLSNIRGLRSNFAIGGSPVVLYIDGIAHADLLSHDHTLLDVASITVHPGPQGHGFGRNAAAGVVDITMVQPGPRPEGAIRLSGGSRSFFGAEASLRGPLGDAPLYLGLSGRVDGREGFVHNAHLGGEMGDQSTKSGRGVLRWLPEDDWDVKLTAAFDSFDDRGGYLIVPIDKAAYVSQTLPMFYSLLGRPSPTPDLDSFESFVDYPGGSEAKSNSLSLSVRHAGPASTLSSITSRRASDLCYSFDSDVSNLDWSRFFLKDDIEQLAQELSLKSHEDDRPLRYQGGLYLERHRLDFDRSDRYGEDFFLVPLGVLPAGSEETFQGRMEDLSLAGYAKASWSLPGDRFELTGGLRYEHVRSSIDRDHFFVLDGTPADLQSGYPLFYGAPTPHDGSLDESRSFTAWLPMAGIGLNLDETHRLSLSATRGFRPGGFNYIDDNPATAGFASETNWTYEATLTGSELDDRINWSLTAFYIDASNYQDLIIYNPVLLAFQNVPGVDIRGLEARLTLRPAQGLELEGTFGTVDPRYRDYTDPMTGQDYSGNTVVLTPEYDYSLTGRWRTRTGLFLQVEAHGAGSAYVDQANTNRLPSYRIYNAKVGYETDRFDIYAFGRNLTDEEYFTFAIGNEGIVGEPLTVGLEATVRF